MLVTTHLKPHQYNDQFLAHALRGAASLIDPFIGVDHVWIRGPVFPMNRYVGMSYLTYLFPDSATGLDHRNSLGDHQLIAPGALHWTTAGTGIEIDEQPVDASKVLHCLRISIDLAEARRATNPRTLRLEAEDVLSVESAGAVVRVLLGRFGNARSPLGPPTDVTLLDISLTRRASIEIIISAGQRAFFLPIAGEITVDDQQFSASEFRIPVFLSQASPRRVLVRSSSDERAQAVFFTGPPLAAKCR
ncbi:pirin family protein [Cupriavidus pampae]|uniref:Pirin N-terminal domain-containing protein n=1 Tax=Cupriavidus pampae TaxID=659251 RepID=A0ABM8XSS2_9BURK|nr:pirin family protein [Cupriavidus pampae]CAG9183388.1 hypothetical protein LMG32289_05364 [Cupriavidus pampae]